MSVIVVCFCKKESTQRCRCPEAHAHASIVSFALVSKWCKCEYNRDRTCITHIKWKPVPVHSIHGVCIIKFPSFIIFNPITFCVWFFSVTATTTTKASATNSSSNNNDIRQEKNVQNVLITNCINSFNCMCVRPLFFAANCKRIKTVLVIIIIIILPVHMLDFTSRLLIDNRIYTCKRFLSAFWVYDMFAVHQMWIKEKLLFVVVQKITCTVINGWKWALPPEKLSICIYSTFNRNLSSWRFFSRYCCNRAILKCVSVYVFRLLYPIVQLGRACSVKLWQRRI